MNVVYILQPVFILHSWYFSFHTFFIVAQITHKNEEISMKTWKSSREKVHIRKKWQKCHIFLLKKWQFFIFYVRHFSPFSAVLGVCTPRQYRKIYTFSFKSFNFRQKASFYKMGEKIHDIFLFIFAFICKKVKKCQAWHFFFKCQALHILR